MAPLPSNSSPFGSPGSLLQIGNTLQTIAQNIIGAVTELQQLMPMFSSGQISANGLVQTGFVRVTGLSVVVIGGAPGFLHDAETLALAGTANEIFSVPAVVGYYPLQMIFAKGLVYKPGAGEKIVVFYVRS